MSDNTKVVTDANFGAEIEQHAGVAVVDFWATWCGPCRLIAPVVDQLAAEYAGKVKVAKLDTDANPHTMTRFGIRSIPTLLFFRDGQVVDRVVGAIPKGQIAERFAKLAAAQAPAA
jgi:thioredoxin 1